MIIVIDGFHPLEEFGVQTDVVAVFGEHGRHLLCQRLHLVVCLRAVEVEENGGDPFEQFARVLHRADGIFECGRLRVVDDTLHLLILYPYALEHRWLIVLQPYAVERKGVVRCVIIINENIAHNVCLFVKIRGHSLLKAVHDDAHSFQLQYLLVLQVVESTRNIGPRLTKHFGQVLHLHLHHLVTVHDSGMHAEETDDPLLYRSVVLVIPYLLLHFLESCAEHVEHVGTYHVVIDEIVLEDVLIDKERAACSDELVGAQVVLVVSENAFRLNERGCVEDFNETELSTGRHILSGVSSTEDVDELVVSVPPHHDCLPLLVLAEVEFDFLEDLLQLSDAQSLEKWQKLYAFEHREFHKKPCLVL